MMYYHASSTDDIKVLEPRLSEHGMPLVYFSRKRENVLVYLSNAIELFCIRNGIAVEEKLPKWGPYGFSEDGRLRLEEYYPDAIRDTYAGISGYIYATEEGNFEALPAIRDAFVSKSPIIVRTKEFIPDAYAAILEAESRGLIVIRRYEEMNGKEKDWLQKTIRREYETAKGIYRQFLEAHFMELLKEEI